MAVLCVESRDRIDLGKKPRIYFTCHPDDFSRCFYQIRQDLLNVQDCAIYYTEDMTAVFTQEELDTDLGRSNLFVVPVTFKLLSTPNRAMDQDIPYAKQAHIPILPFMMEPGIDEFYAKPDKFGAIQYLKPNSADSTEIAYEQKLKNYLSSVLISDALAERVRAAFDVYIFLSYRKKDRRYANELMRLIHSNPQCRDIAIWFDEFLTPGENFRDSISKIMNNSQLFMLLVTPNLLEEPNFVMAEEYPAAQKAGLEILPAEMVDTDHAALQEKYRNIPDCVNLNHEEFHARLLDSIIQHATEANNTPEHNYLIGLAYLDGIDVEVDRKYALELITSAAESGLPEAMDKLYTIYSQGIGTKPDYQQVIKWLGRYLDYTREHYGDNHPVTLSVRSQQATAYGMSGDNETAMDLLSQIVSDQISLLGIEHPDTLISMTNLATSLQQFNFSNIVAGSQILSLFLRVYEIRRNTLGESHPDTINALHRLAGAYGHCGNHKKALETAQTVYPMEQSLLGEDHPDTLLSLRNLSAAHDHLGNHSKSLELNKQIYALHCRKFGKEHPDTLGALTSLANAYARCNDHRKSLELYEQVYAMYCETLGEEHPNTIDTLEKTAIGNYNLGNYQEAVRIQETVFSLRRKIYGEEHWKTQRSLRGLAECYGSTGQIGKSNNLYWQGLKKLFHMTVQLFRMPRKNRYRWLMDHYNKHPQE